VSVHQARHELDGGRKVSSEHRPEDAGGVEAMKDEHGLLLVHEDLVPSERATADSVAGAEWKMEYSTRLV